MVNMVNITPAKYQHVNIVIVSMLACDITVPKYSLTELLAQLSTMNFFVFCQESLKFVGTKDMYWGRIFYSWKHVKRPALSSCSLCLWTLLVKFCWKGVSKWNQHKHWFSVFKAERRGFSLKCKLILLNRNRSNQVKFRQMLSRSKAEASYLEPGSRSAVL